MEFRRLSVAIAYVLSGYQAAAIAAPVPHSVPATPSRSEGDSNGEQFPSNESTSPQASSGMRPLTVKEVELIMGTNASTTPLTGTSVTATVPPTGGGGGGNPGGGGDGNGGSGGDGGSGGGGGGTTPPPAQPHCYTPLDNLDRVDSSHIYANEDGIHTTGYLVAGAPNGGVTIGAGVDLGSQSESGLQNIGIAQGIIDIVKPYLGLKGSVASAYVNAHGFPTLKNTDAISLSLGLLNSTEQTVRARFDAATTGAQFQELPADAQTVIVDVAYPNGPYLSSSAPSFWSDVTSGNWTATINELNNWYGTNNSNSRYQGDAALLQSAINAATLPSDNANGQCK